MAGTVDRVFCGKYVYDACRAAELWCRENGYSVGFMSGNDPRGLVAGRVHVAKWDTLTDDARKKLDGIMTGDMRNGPVRVLINPKKPAV